LFYARKKQVLLSDVGDAAIQPGSLDCVPAKGAGTPLGMTSEMLGKAGTPRACGRQLGMTL
jgi:hypothetical protein